MTDTIAENPAVGVVIALGVIILLGVMQFVVRPRLPEPAWGWRFAADPLVARFRMRDGATAVFAAAGWSGELAEKVTLLGLLGVIFASVIPNVEAPPLQVALGVVLIVGANTAISMRFALSGRAGGGRAVARFAALVVANLALSFLDTPCSPVTPSSSAQAVFAGLITLILWLFDVYWPIYDARFDRSPLGVTSVTDFVHREGLRRLDRHCRAFRAARGGATRFVVAACPRRHVRDRRPPRRSRRRDHRGARDPGDQGASGRRDAAGDVGHDRRPARGPRVVGARPERVQARCRPAEAHAGDRSVSSGRSGCSAAADGARRDPGRPHIGLLARQAPRSGSHTVLLHHASPQSSPLSASARRWGPSRLRPTWGLRGGFSRRPRSLAPAHRTPGRCRGWRRRCGRIDRQPARRRSVHPRARTAKACRAQRGALYRGARRRSCRLVDQRRVRPCADPAQRSRRGTRGSSGGARDGRFVGLVAVRSHRSPGRRLPGARLAGAAGASTRPRWPGRGGGGDGARSYRLSCGSRRSGHRRCRVGRDGGRRRVDPACRRAPACGRNDGGGRGGWLRRPFVPFLAIGDVAGRALAPTFGVPSDLAARRARPAASPVATGCRSPRSRSCSGSAGRSRRR